MRIKKLLSGTVLLFIVVYLAAYVVLARGGGYVWVASGQVRLVNHLATADMLVWQPGAGTFYPFRKVGGEDTYQSDFLGKLYSPLILLHQKCLARSIRTLEADGSAPNHAVALPRRDQLHPSARRELADTERSLGLTWEQIAEKFAEKVPAGSER
jgi:hypothetical protein